MGSKELPVSLPLSMAQRGLWMAQFIAPPGSSFNIAEAIYLDGDINEELFLRSLYWILDEIDILRSRVTGNFEGLRLTFTDEPVVFPFIDMSGEENASEVAWEWMQTETRKPVDVKTDPLWKNALIKIAENRYVWFHCGHHIVLDGYSGGIIAARVAQIYTALFEGKEPEPSIFYQAETLLEQEKIYTESKRYESDEAYWLTELANVPEPVSLSLRPHKPITGENGGELSREISLSSDIVSRITAVGKGYGQSLPQTLTALLAAYIFLVTEQDDLAIGMPVSARINRIVRRTPGMVANGVVLRFRFDEGTTFVNLLQQSKSLILRALRHQLFRYEGLRRSLGLLEIGQHLSRLGINIEPFDYKLIFGECVARNKNLSNGSMQDLTFFVFDRQDGRGLTIQADANPALYTSEELDGHLERIRLVVQQFLENPEQSIRPVSLISVQEEAHHRQEAGAALRKWPDEDLVALFERSLRDGGQSAALFDCDGELSSHLLLEQAGHLSEKLKAAGLKPGHLVAVALPRDRRMVITLLAVLKAGLAWVAIDTESPQERARIVLEDSDPALVVIGDAELVSWCDNRPVLLLDAEGKGDISGAGLSQAVQSVPPRTAYVSYTSGTTGRPKGVIVPRSALYNLLLSMKEVTAFSNKDRLLAVTGLTFDISVLELLLPLISGGAVVIATYTDVRTPKVLTERMAACGVTFIQATPTLYQTITGSGLSAAFRGVTVLSGGEPISPALAQELMQSAKAVFNVYGPTETTIWSTACQLTAETCDNPPVGKPLANTSLFIVNRDGQSLPDGVIGELLIAGAGVATGYLRRPELTSERFIMAPSGERAYRTGDRAVRTPDGTVLLMGRADDQVKIRGMRIETGEVESVILELPDIRQAAVIAEKSPDNMTAVLVAYLVADKQDSIALRRQISEKLPAQMVPGRIVYVDSLPRTSAGKLDRRALKALVPQEESVTEKVLPSTPEEKILAEIWADLLQVKEIDVNTNFFSLGGDSLMVLQMISRLSEMGYELPVGQVFTVPTVAALAPALAGKGEATDPLSVLLPLRPTGQGTPFFCIHPVLGVSWSFNTLAGLLPPEHPVYALQDASLVLDDNPPGSIDDIIDIYLAEILKVSPHGPYNFVGWSMGGLIAHGLCARLRARGEQIEMLAMLDSYPFEKEFQGKVLGSEESVRLAVQFLDITPPEDGAPLPTTVEEVANLFLEGLDISQLPKSIGRSEEDQRNLASVFLQVTLRNMELLQQYTPCYGETDIVFIRAAVKGGDMPQSVLLDRPQQWQKYTSGKVIIHEQQVRHQDMLKTGYVEKISFILNDYLKHKEGEVRSLTHELSERSSDQSCGQEAK